ncbi:MAG: hypothetical protein LBE20_06795 [Deltaproteobacteria bacterium]|jgi:Holliday junction resolvasome RuvABC endonuclease subunit|nr:hypothetical protein [Deltaproteobacteria bacterium]
MSINSFKKLLAIDPSLTSTGWVLFDLQTGTIRQFGILNDPGPKIVLARRLAILQQEIEALLSAVELQAGDVLVCEGPAHLVLNPQSALKVEHVRGMFEVLARKRGVDVPGRVNPRIIHTEILGLKGKQVKRAEVKKIARSVAERLFVKEFANNQNNKLNSRRKVLSQDIIDAALIGAFCITQIDLCQKLKIDLAEAFHEGRRSFKKSHSTLRWRECDVVKLG